MVRLFDDKMLKSIFWPKAERGRGGWGKNYTQSSFVIRAYHRKILTQSNEDG